MRIKIEWAAALALALTACGAGRNPETSVTKERYDIDTSTVPPDAARGFVTHARAIADAGSGHFTVEELVSLLPMQDDQRQLLKDAFTTSLDATCDGARCTAQGDGRAVEATIEIVAGIIRHPLLGLNAHVEVQFVKRGDAAVEFCNVQGIYLRKSFIRKSMQGLYVDGGGAAPKVTAQVGNDAQNYTCE